MRGQTQIASLDHTPESTPFLKIIFQIAAESGMETVAPSASHFWRLAFCRVATPSEAAQGRCLATGWSLDQRASAWTTSSGWLACHPGTQVRRQSLEAGPGRLAKDRAHSSRHPHEGEMACARVVVRTSSNS